MPYYKVTGLNLNIKVTTSAQFYNWTQFERSPDSSVDMTIKLEQPVTINRDIGFARTPAVRNLFFAGDVVMYADKDYRNAYLFQRPEPEIFEILASYLFYTHAVRRQMIQLHASIIHTLGRGVVFLGPSGIGKTTQAERWAEYRSASIINGDIVFVQQTEEGFLGWGTPWHGSSPYCLNASVPVKALVVLKQAPYNALRELTGFEKVSEVANSVFYPTWLEDGMELCTATLDRLLTQVPVYRLDNRADEEAVALLERELDRIS